MSAFSNSSQQAKNAMISRFLVISTLLIALSAIFGIAALELFNVKINCIYFTAEIILVASAYATVDLVLVGILNIILRRLEDDRKERF